MPNSWKKLLSLGLMGAAALALTGCQSRQAKTPVSQGNEQQILHVSNRGEPETLDPHISTGIVEYKVTSALFEGLISPDPQTLEARPGVAQTWDILDKGARYIFHLNPDAKWSNGDPVTAQDFVYSYKRVLTAELGANYASSFFIIKHAEQYFNGKLSNFDQVGVKALDEHTLEITLEDPTPHFLAILKHLTWFPVHQKSIEAVGSPYARSTPWARPGKLVSNGPFKLKSWNLADKIIVERNQQYWDNSTTKLNEIHYYPIDSLQTEEKSFISDQVHITESIPSTRIKHYLDIKSPELWTQPWFSTYSYIFDTEVKPFDDVRIRKAFALSINRQSLVDNVSQKGEQPAFSQVPPNLAGYTPSKKLYENVDEARALLAEAGYPNGENFPKITLLYNTSDNHKKIAEALQYFWKQNLGVNVELVNQEWKVYVAARKKNEHHLIRFGWVGDYLDPNAFLEVFQSNAGNNFASWKNKSYDQLLSRAQMTVDPVQRYSFLAQAEDILTEEVPVLPFYYWNVAYLKKQSVKGYYPNTLDQHPYKYIYLEPEA